MSQSHTISRDPRGARRRRAGRWAAGGAHVLGVMALCAGTTFAAGTEEFNRDIRPILSENCFACHGPDSASRKADLRLDRREVAVEAGAIVPGDPEASFLMRKVHASGPAEVLALGARGVYELGFSLAQHWREVEALLRKYASRPVSLADASLIRLATIHQDARVLTFDSDFSIYRWDRNRKFDVL